MTRDVPCDEIMLAVMALADGETPDVPATSIEAHLDGCASCKTWSTELADMTGMFDRCERLTDSHDLWPTLAPALVRPQTTPARNTSVAPFVVLVAALVGYRVLLYAAQAPEHVLKLLAVVLIVVAFAVARENPFRIETGHTLGVE